jgi:hypothetical protein
MRPFGGLVGGTGSSEIWNGIYIWNYFRGGGGSRGWQLINVMENVIKKDFQQQV